MSIALTFVDKNLLESPIVGSDGAVHYTTSTTHGVLHRKVTTIMAASGLVGTINWRDESFVINGVQRGWDSLRSRSGGIFSSCAFQFASRPIKNLYQGTRMELGEPTIQLEVS